MRKDVNPNYEWYDQLEKPSWAPPRELFGTVWSFLYPLIIASFAYVFYRTLQGDYPSFVAIPFVLNLILNAAFTPLQFKLRSNMLALIDIVAVVATLIWAMSTVYYYSRVAAWVQIPYLLWIAFATFLQFRITILNRGGKGSARTRRAAERSA